MNTSTNKNGKGKYTAPEIIKILIDNQISLVLESEPPIGPGEEIVSANESFKTDIFKSGLG